MADIRYRIRLFQLEENGGGTDIQIAAGTERVYETGGSSNTIFPITVSNIVQSVEVDKGIYSLDDVSLTVKGLGSTYFNNYDDIINNPYVVTIEDLEAATVLFHGVVDNQEISWDATNQWTSFSVLSWEYILEKTERAARLVVETNLLEDFEDSQATTFTSLLKIPRTIQGKDMTTVLSAGDVVVLDTSVGEFRTRVSDIEDILAGSIRLRVFTSFNSSLGSFNFTDITDPDLSKFVALSGSSSGIVYRAQVVDPTFWAEVKDAENDQERDVRMGFVIGGGGPSGSIVIGIGRDIRVDALGRPLNSSNFAKASDDGQTVDVYFNSGPPTDAQIDASGITLNFFRTTKVTAGNNIRILTDTIYGVTRSYDFEVQDVLDGMFSLTEIGAMRFVVDTVTTPTLRLLRNVLEYPPNLRESLELITNSNTCFTKLIPTIDGGNLPRLEVELVNRTAANTVSTPVVAVSDVISWKQNTASTQPTSVIVNSFLQYNAPDTEGQFFKTIGFHYEGIGSVDPQLASVPDDSESLVIEINEVPRYTGTVFTGTGESIRNDDGLSYTAQKFFDFYKNLEGEATAVIDGIVDPSIVGQFANINEGILSVNLYVLEHSVDMKTQQTTLHGRVGEYTLGDTANPVAVIEGNIDYYDLDGSGNERVILNAQRSYDPLALEELTYEWRVSAVLVSTDPELDTTLAVGSHPVELTVTKSISLSTDVENVTVEVHAQPTDIGDQPENTAEFTIQNIDIDDNGDVFLSAAGNVFTETTGGIRVETRVVPAAFAPIVGSPFNNPQSLLQVHTGLGQDDTLEVRVTLINASDGTDGQQWIGAVSNVRPSDSLTVNDLIVNNDADFNIASGQTFDVDVNAVDVLLIDGTGMHVDDDLDINAAVDIDAASGEVVNININGNEVMEVAETNVRIEETLDVNAGIDVDAPNGDTVSITIDATEVLLVEETDVTVDADLTVDTGHVLNVDQTINIATEFTPTSSADAAGNDGDIAIDGAFIYYKDPTNGWVRAALSTF